MLRSYFKIAIRNLWKSKGFSALNITGLAIGMAGAILISLWIINEVSFDRFHKNTDNLYMAWNRGMFDNELQCWEATPKPLGPAMKLEFPEVANYSRLYRRWFVTRYKDIKISSESMIVDPAFLSMFSFPLVKGNPQTALNDVYSILVTENFAKKMFGNDEPLNKVIQIDSNNFTVRGVLKNFPNNTMFSCEFMLPWSYMKAVNQDDQNWGNNSVYNFMQLQPGVDLNAFAEKMKGITVRHTNNQEQQEVFLHPLSMLHLYSRFENGKVAGGRIETVRIFTVIAIFILIIACINFMNLSTARSEKRAREVGIRKIAGANKSRLVGQFLGESTLISLIAGIIALGIVQLSLPSFNLLISKQLSVPFDSAAFWLSSIVFVLFTGLIAGSYPAFFLSSFNPIRVLKGTFKKAHAAINPRKVLVVVQFTFAITLIICTIIIVQQMKHGQERETGYERGQLVYHWLAGDLYENFALIKNELITSGVATNVTRTSSPLTSSFSTTWSFQWKGKDPNNKTEFQRFIQDEGLIKTAGLKLLQGRDFNLAEFPTDSSALLLNESAAKVMGIDEPRGQIVTDGPFKFHVVGIFKDFIIGSPFDRTYPMVVQGALANWFNIIHIKLNPANSTASNLVMMEKIFRKYNPNYPFEYHFTDQDYAAKFNETERTATLTGLFAGLTILISCLGLLGLAAYMAENRIREIGIRKVLGASVLKITSLLSKDFLLLVIISLLIATPVAWYAMRVWLEDYTYRIDIQWWVFAGAGLLSILISLATVSYQAIRAALANPVKSLRSE
ncbi:MAG: ABC transporter permease [Chitinophagaceae bacterium]|nr:ABC transporter permease [Chitinophagaceae bacterium]